MSKTVLITGASSGFGLLTAVTLAKRGWRVIATMRHLDRRDRLDAAAIATSVSERIEVKALDVTNDEQISSLVSELEARSLSLDALVNNAGFAMAGFAEDVSSAELRKQFDTNFFGTVAVTRAFLPQFRRQRSGHIVTVSSISGRLGYPGVGSYSASKFALEGWTETLRYELKALGIKVVLVEPGAFATDIWTRNADMAVSALDVASPNAVRMADFRKRVATDKRRADPQVVANVIAAILENPQPRLRYLVGKDAKIGLTMHRLLPRALFERLILKSTGMDR
jgi:NAD(P)-dependent dehydrogenase (short-subunit alcohol dehydrogenase family)